MSGGDAVDGARSSVVGPTLNVQSRLFVLPQDGTMLGIDADTDAVQVLEVYYYAAHRFVIIHSRFFPR